MNRRLTVHIEDQLSRLARFSYLRPLQALAVAVLLSAIALVGARRLSVDTDLAHLLPDSFASVQDLNALIKRAGTVGYVVVVVEGATSEARQAYAQEIAPQLSALPSIHYVDYQRPLAWFADRALYFATPDQLEEAAARISRRANWEKRRHNPMYLDLEGGPAPPLEFGDLRNSAETPRWLSGASREPYYEDSERGMLVMLARPRGRATDMAFAKTVVGDVQQVLKSSPPPGELTASLTGRFVKKLDQKAQISGDLGLTSLLALGLVLFYLAAHFRRLSAVALLAVPLAIGILWTFGAVGFIYGGLNILTAFVGAILLGLGIDHGIHLLSAYDNARSSGAKGTAAIAESFGHTGRAVMVAALTTMAGFAGVALSEFRAFHEFGVVTALGMATIVVAYLLVLPALLGLWQRRALPAPAKPAAVTQWALKSPRATSVAVGVLAVGLTVPILKLNFDYDFAALEDSALPSFQLDHEVNRVLGYSQTPTVVLTDSPEQEAEVAAAVRKTRKADGDTTTIDMVATVADLVPPQQAEKQALLLRIQKMVSRVKPAWLNSDQDREKRSTLLRMTRAAPFKRSDLPTDVTRQFTTAGSTEQPTDAEGFVLVFPSISLSDGQRVPELAREVRQAAGGAPVAGESMILADILEMIKREGPTVMMFTAGLVSFTLWLLIGSFTRAALSLAAAALTVGGALGLAGALGIPLNYLNIIVIPVLFGIAVDGGVHLLSVGDGQADTLATTARAIGGALLTTGLGFGALMLADHPGLRSVGLLALIGLGVNALITMVLLPSLLANKARSKFEPEGVLT